MDYSLSRSSVHFPGKNAGGGSHFLLQGNLPHPGVEPRSPTLAGAAWKASMINIRVNFSLVGALGLRCVDQREY